MAGAAPTGDSGDVMNTEDDDEVGETMCCGIYVSVCRHVCDYDRSW